MAAEDSLGSPRGLQDEEKEKDKEFRARILGEEDEKDAVVLDCKATVLCKAAIVAEERITVREKEKESVAENENRETIILLRIKLG